MNDCAPSVYYISACGKATCDELRFFTRSSLFPPELLWWLSVYVKGPKQILVAVCIVEFAGFNYPVCKLLFYTVKFTACSVNVFTDFLYYHSCQNYFVKICILLFIYFFTG